MSDDAQTPPRVPLSKPDQAGGAAPVPQPWAPPVNDGSAGPGATIADTASPTPHTPSVHDQQTVTSLPGLNGSPAPRPWASPFTPLAPSAPANGSAGNPFAPPAPSAPANGSAGNPFVPPAPSAPVGGPAGPFAPPVGPSYAQGEPVPPPPISPDGPGQVPYGYPGGYGYPSQPSYGGGAHGPQSQGAGAYYGWPGMTPVPSNGLGTAGLVIGIISAVGFCLWPIAILLGIMAVVFGMIGRGKAHRGEATNPGQALAGIICGAAGIVLGLVMVAFLIAT
ncbi:DUF4190 domain-containing protein [Streptomyces sp. HUCO-GS316]|uniref:DUF4190 domain-containing protein n=1 Tax=Streptomyces sp. HUCO-GS316 TaxID=2692198 RepID=UPI001F447704|nr:DUF4190 domain-containing protein [Streptomyces sp. HUCO-GS316]